MEFLDHQRYSAGSDARAIDWRASARSRHCLVRRHHDESASEWYVCLDRSASMGVAGGAKWLLALQLSAACLYLLLGKAQRAGLLAFSGEIDAHCPPGRGRAQYARTLALLRDLEPRARGGASRLAACAGPTGARRSALVISDFLVPDAMRAGLDSILAFGGQVRALQVLSTDECAPRLDGPTVVQDVESGARRAVSAAAGQAAARRLEGLQDVLRDHCRRRGIALTQCRGGQAWQAVVLKHLAHARDD